MTHPHSLLPPSTNVELAIRGLNAQGEYGAITALANEYEVSRPTVYAKMNRAEQALEREFGATEAATWTMTLELGEEDIRRAVVGLRVLTPASIRDIEDALPVLYGVHWSFGKIQYTLVEAEQSAQQFLAGVDLSGISHVALDEMFSQRRPVFGGIDLDTQYLFMLAVHDNRTGAQWEEALGELRDRQGLNPKVVTKDAGKGLASGVTGAWPGAEHYDDLFHAVYLTGKVAVWLENRAYGAIGKEGELERKRERANSEHERRCLGQQLRKARRNAEEAIGRYDRFEALRRQVQRALELADRGSGVLRTPEEVVDTLTRAASEMLELGTRRIRQVATYLHNRAEGLARYLIDLRRRLDAVADETGGPEVVAAVLRAYQASLDAGRCHPYWERAAVRDELQQATVALLDVTGRDNARLLRALSRVLPVLHHRYRASSAIENLNSVLRPYLVVQKCAQQGFLNLFAYYWNMRIRRWGPMKGTSPHEMLTGEPVGDWLTLLGYPPSRETRAAS